MDTERNKNIFSKMRDLFWNWKKRGSISESERNSELEAEHRRHQTRRGIRNFCRGLWNEANVSRRVESSLRKRLREKEGERIQRAKEKVHERNSRVTKLCDTPGYKDFIKFKQKCESIAYMGLRHPELRNDKHTLDYYLGFYNGILSNIEDDRKFFQDALFNKAKEEREAEEEQQQKEESK